MTSLLWLTTLIACDSADQSFSSQSEDIYANGGFAGMTWSPNELVFEELTEGIWHSLEINIVSTGESTLKIDKADIATQTMEFSIDTSATEDIYRTWSSTYSHCTNRDLRRLLRRSKDQKQ